MSIIASFFLWLVPVLSEDSEQCNSVPRSPETTLWCQTSCQQLLAFVRMRMPYGTMDFQVLRRANEMNTWSVCPSAFRSIVFARLAEEIEGLGQGDLKVAQERLVAAEFAAREFVFTNISGYLEAGTSFAPWFHLNCVFGALERFSEALPERKELSKQSEAVVAALKEHLAADWPLMSPLQRLKAQGWSLRPSTLERAALLLAEADFQRVREAYGIPGSGGVMGAAREEMRRLLHLGQRFLAQAYLHGKASAPLGATKSHGLLTLAWQSRVPIFELLDRIDSQVLEPIHLRTSPRFADVQFHMHVLPTRNVESNHVRAFFALHCDQVFRDMVEEHQEVQNLMVVEVGTHLGGCVLHALTHLPPSTRALAIDAYGPAVAALRRTAEANGLQQQLAVVEKFICLDATRRYAVNLMATGPTLLQPAWREASDSQLAGAAECGSLEAVFQQQGVSQVDLLRIHVLGREADALRSGERFFASGQVKQVAATVSQSSVDPGGMALMLYRHGYELRFREFHGADAVAVLQNKMLLPKSTQTLTARRPR